MLMICSRCKTRQAIIQVVDPNSTNKEPQWLCVECIKELEIKPFANMFEKMGITDDDIQTANEQLMEIFDSEDMENSGFKFGGATIFPFNNNIIQNLGNLNGSTNTADADNGKKSDVKGKNDKKDKKKVTEKKLKIL